MRQFLAILVGLFLSVAQSAYAFEFSSTEEASSWINNYYKNPEPDKFPAAILRFSKDGFLQKKPTTTAPMFGFTSGVFHNNPDSIYSMASELDHLNESEYQIVVLGLWYSDTKNYKEVARVILDKHPDLKSLLKLEYDGPPIKITQIPLEQGPWVLDALWGYFLATGDEAPVLRIIEATALIDKSGDSKAISTGGAAMWSLASNARQHTRVMEICVSQIEKQPESISTKLKEIVEKAKE